MPGIFISYRREDSAGHAGRLFDRLKEHFGANHVFMDVTTIKPGFDFVEAIETAVGSCDIVLVIIGKQWLNCKDPSDPSGGRRLDNPKDFIHLETAIALNRIIPVVPVLVQNARMPGQEELPKALEKLSRRHAVELSDSRWDSDVRDLIRSLTDIVAEKPTPLPLPRETVLPTYVSFRRATVILAAAMLVIGGILIFLLRMPVGIEVPQVVGSKVEVAKAILEGKQLGVGTLKNETSDERPEGTVLKQLPEAGQRLDRGAKVDLVIVARSSISVPNVVGQPIGKAENLLKEAGFLRGRRDQKPTEEALPGIVLTQLPSAGERVDKDKKVDLVVAVRPKIAVPDVTKIHKDQAVSVLAKVGLVVGGVRERDAGTVRDGWVLSQVPPAGEQVVKGTKVDLVVAVVVRRVVVPQLITLSLGEAKAELEKIGLVLGLVRTRETISVYPQAVLDQIPPSGQLVDRGSKIDLVVATVPRQ